MLCPKSQHVKILKWDPYTSLDDAMEFRLLYDGLLLGSNKTDTRARHKHDIRKIFHKQLKILWSTNPHLANRANRRTDVSLAWQVHTDRYVLDDIADEFRVGNLRCVPLVTTQLELACGLDILFLRYDQPGATLIQSGDIDNRIKTVFDALRRPQTTSEACAEPADDENPLFCLLEDDKLITHLSVTTDLLLEPNMNVNDVRLIITVRIRPTSVTFGNIDFGF